MLSITTPPGHNFTLNTTQQTFHGYTPYSMSISHNEINVSDNTALTICLTASAIILIIALLSGYICSKCSPEQRTTLINNAPCFCKGDEDHPTEVVTNTNTHNNEQNYNIVIVNGIESNTDTLHNSIPQLTQLAKQLCTTLNDSTQSNRSDNSIRCQQPSVRMARDVEQDSITHTTYYQRATKTKNLPPIAPQNEPSTFIDTTDCTNSSTSSAPRHNQTYV